MIYLISRIGLDAHSHSDFVGKRAGLFFKEKVFFPHKNNPVNVTHDKMEMDVFNLDLRAMKQSSRAVVSLPIGRDCSAELGWFSGANKYVCVFLVKSAFSSVEIQLENLLGDWMLKGFIDEVFVEDFLVYQFLKKDNILKYKISLLEQ